MDSASPELARRMWLLNDLFAASAAHTAERMSMMALDHLHEFRARAKAILQVNRKLLDEFLDRRSELECVRPSAGTIAFPRLIRGDAENFFNFCETNTKRPLFPGGFSKCRNISASVSVAKHRNCAAVSNA